MLDNGNTEIAYKDLQKMKYLEAVVNESLRMKPVVPAIDRKLSFDVIISEYAFDV